MLVKALFLKKTLVKVLGYKSVLFKNLEHSLIINGEQNKSKKSQKKNHGFTT